MTYEHEERNINWMKSRRHLYVNPIPSRRGLRTVVMESEPEEGEIREGKKRARHRSTDNKISEDERPRGYRMGRVNCKRRAGLSQRPSSPAKSRQRSRESTSRKNRKRLSLSETRRDGSTSRNRVGRIQGPRSASGSRCSRSRSPGLSERLKIRRKSSNYNNRGSYEDVNTRPIKKPKKRGNHFSKRRCDGTNCTSMISRPAKPIDDCTNEKLPKNLSKNLVPENEMSPSVQNENIHDISLTSISPTPLNGLSTLENVEDVSEEEEVAVVSVIQASDRRPELIVLDSTSSSEEDADDNANDKVVAARYEEEDLEELELRKQALEGLVRKLNPSDSNMEILPEAGAKSCDNNQLTVPAVPTDQVISNSLNISTLGANLRLTSSLKELQPQKSKEVMPADKSSDGNENETELELCLLRAKLLSDLAKKSKPNPSSPASGSEFPSNASVSKKLIPIPHDLPNDAGSDSFLNTTDKRGPLVTPSVFRILPTAGENYASITNGQEHERPTSYAYAPMPVEPAQLQFTNFSVSVSNHNNARTVVSHPGIFPNPSHNNVIRTVMSLPVILPSSPHHNTSQTNVASISPLPSLHNTSRPRVAISPIRLPINPAAQVRRVEVLESTVTFHTKPTNSVHLVPAAVQNSTVESASLLPKSVNGIKSASKDYVKPTSSTSASQNSVTIDERLLNPKNVRVIPHKSIPVNGNRVTLKSTNMNPQPNNISRYNRTTVHRMNPRFPPPKRYKSIVIPLRECDTSSEEEDSNETNFDEPLSKKPVPLGDAFHSSLDNFLKKVRESASQNQARTSTSPVLPSTSPIGNAKVSSLVNPAAQVEGTIISVDAQSTGVGAVTPLDPAEPATSCTKKTISAQDSKQKQLKRPSGPKDEDIFDNNSPSPTATESNEHSTNGSESTLSSADTNIVACSSTGLHTLRDYKNSKIGSSSVLTSAKNVTLKPSSPSRVVVLSAPTSPEDGSILTDSTQIPSPSVVSENLIPSKPVVEIGKTREEISGPTNAGRPAKTSSVVPKVTNAAQTREELQLREKLLRITLLKSEKKLKLTNTEKQLIDTRLSATEQMGKLLDKVVKYSEKEKQCSDMEKQVLRIKRQLEMVEKNLVSAKKETTTLQEDFMKSAGQAFATRKKSIDLRKTCIVIGKQIIGDEYRVPSKGAADMLKKVKEIHKHSILIKKLKAGSIELNEIEKQFQAALAGRNPKSCCATRIGNLPDMSTSSQLSSDEESWNAFKSQGLTKYLRTASKNQGYELKTAAQRSISKKITDVMQAKPIPFGIYFPYDSPTSCVGLQLRVQSIMKPICADSITSTCQKSDCKFQHLSR